MLLQSFALVVKEAMPKDVFVSKQRPLSYEALSVNLTLQSWQAAVRNTAQTDWPFLR
jgi:hypothetical protein